MYSRHPGRIFTLPFKRRRVLVLTGGGSRGAAQVGMIRALHESGLRFDAVIGCSVGALNGAIYAADPDITAVESLEKIWLRIQPRDLFPIRPISLVQGIFTRSHLFPADALEELIARELPFEDISSTAVPFGVVTTDLVSGESVFWREGPAAAILTASAALPGFYPPVKVGERMHIDGGLSSAAPVNAAVNYFNASEVWVLDVLGKTKPTARTTVRHMFDTAFTHALRTVADAEIKQQRRARVHHLVLPEHLRVVDSTNFRQTDELIKAGHTTAKTYLRDV